MLPPFVPPSARVPTQILPLITEFVVDRGERTGSSSVATAPWESETRAVVHDLGHESAPELDHESVHRPAHELALPSIDEFLLRPVSGARSEPPSGETQTEATSEHVLTSGPFRDATGPVETSTEVTRPTATSSEEASVSEPVALVQAYLAETQRTEPEQPDAAMEPPSSEPAQEEPQRPAADEPEVETDEAPVTDRTTQEAPPGDVSGADTPLSQNVPEAWVSEERDSFNWQSAANLAAGPDEERRASKEWSSTNWEPRGGGSQDHIVALLGQVARRVRSGELQIHGNRRMTAEAALAAVLAALLAEPD